MIIKKFNIYKEEAIWNSRNSSGKPFYREYSKKDMFIEGRSKCVRCITEPNINDSYITIDNAYRNTLHFNVGRVFGERVDRSSRYRLGFDDTLYTSSLKFWWSPKYYFNLLRTISNKLGYSLNKTVVLNKRDVKIIEISNAAFYATSYDYIGIEWTLLYRVEGDSKYYTIDDIELSSNSSSNIIDIEIEENFYDLIDDGIVEYKSELYKLNGADAYKCTLNIKKMSAEYLYNISDILSTAAKRLKDKNINVEISELSIGKIEFICYE